MYGDFGACGMWGMGGFGMIVLWTLLILGVVYLVRVLTQAKGLDSAGEAKPPNRALEMLRERYARGEIDKDEFEARKRDLT